MQQQSSEAENQQNQWACIGLQSFKCGCCLCLFSKLTVVGWKKIATTDTASPLSSSLPPHPIHPIPACALSFYNISSHLKALLFLIVLLDHFAGTNHRPNFLDLLPGQAQAPSCRVLCQDLLEPHSTRHQRLSLSYNLYVNKSWYFIVIWWSLFYLNCNSSSQTRISPFLTPKKQLYPIRCKGKLYAVLHTTSCMS